MVATHPTRRSRCWPTPTDAEREVLGAFSYSRNETLLHTDASIMPRAAQAPASWNYRMPGCAVDTDAVQVTY